MTLKKRIIKRVQKLTYTIEVLTLKPYIDREVELMGLMAEWNEEEKINLWNMICRYHMRTMKGLDWKERLSYLDAYSKVLALREEEVKAKPNK